MHSKTTQTIDPAILPYITYGLDEAKGLYEGDNLQAIILMTLMFQHLTQSTNALANGRSQSKSWKSNDWSSSKYY